MQNFNEISQKLQNQKIYVRKKHLLDVSLRKQYLERLFDIITAKKDQIIAAVDADLGHSPFKSQFTEVDKTLGEIELCLSKLDSWVTPEKVQTPLLLFPAKSFIFPEPFGQVLIISPWNYPFNLAMVPLVGALAAGNSCVIKPSELSSHTSKLIQQIVTEALPSDVAFVVEGAVEETTFLLDQRFDLIFYTGNGQVGRIIMQKAVKHLTPVILELGGKSPTFVYTDQLDLAAKRIVFGKFFNCGQTCIAPDYVILKEKDKKAFVEYAAKWIKEFYADVSKSSDYGRIINERHFKRLESLLEDSNILYGGQRDLATKYIAPTIVESSIDAKVMKEEIFGPILPIITYESLDEAIEFVLDQDKPLACYGFVDQESDSKKIIDLVSAGGIVINDCLLQFANGNLPFGGVGESGMGFYHGKHSFDVFSHKKPVVKTNYVAENALRYPPYEKKAGMVLKLAKWLG